MVIVFAILLFSLLIFIHELGHFIAAKLSGVQVNEFAMFMGPAILKWGKGETQYSIRCIPIGGYCAMEGENEETDNPRSFQKAAWWKRLIILAAGSAANFIAGLLIFLLVFSPAEKIATPVIVEADPGCTVVSEEGLHVGDRFLAINEERIYVSSNVTMLLGLEQADTYDILVERDGKEVLLDDFKMQTHLFDNGDGTQSRRYGFTFGVEDADFGKVLELTWNTAIDTVRTVRLSLQMLLTGKASFSDLSGPVGIVQIMSDTAAASETAWDAFMNVLYFGGFIAINLSVMNLLPIPALDGGRIVGLLLTTVIEKITRKKLSSKVETYIHGVGMVLLLALMAIIMFKDIFALF